MADDAQNNADLSAAQSYDELVRAFGLIFTNAFLYGMNHSVTRKSIEDGYAIFQAGIGIYKQFMMNVTEDGGLMINNVNVEQKNPLTKNFVKTLLSLELRNFSVSDALTRPNFDKLLTLLNTKPEEVKKGGGIQQALTAQGIQGAKAANVTYVAITEDETVINKAAAAGMGENDPNAEMIARIQSVLAFLQGEKGVDDMLAVQNAKDMPSKDLAELLVHSAVRPGPGGIGGGDGSGGDGSGAGGGAGGSGDAGGATPENAGPDVDVLIGYLRKVYGGMVDDPSMRTQKGKKELDKTLSVLETAIFDLLKDQAGLPDDATARISDAVEEMQDELKIDALADEYMKKRHAMDTSEMRIMRYLKKKGVDKAQGSELKDKLAECGLSVQEWNELVVRSAGGNQEDVAVDKTGELNMLNDILIYFGKMRESTALAAGGGTGGGAGESGIGGGIGVAAAVPKSDVKEAIVEIKKHVNSMATKAESAVGELVAGLKAEEVATAGAPAGPAQLTKRKLLVILAEVVQEICQPLAVINCSVGMVLSGGLGDVGEDQKEMLKLAVASGEKMKQITDKMMEMSGVPTTLSPDSGIQSSLYV